MKFLAYLALGALFNPLVLADPSICSQKKNQYGNRFISCDTVEWEGTPLSADFHSFNTAPMTAAPEQVKSATTGKQSYLNYYPYIKDSRLYFEGNFYGNGVKGLSLANKYIGVQKNRLGTSSPTFKYLSGKWYADHQPKSQGDGTSWYGSCDAYAGIANNASWKSILGASGSVQHGLICQGVPFSKGELKEILVALSPSPALVSWKRLSGFYASIVANAEELEDANVALSKLGLLGTGDFKPEDVLSIAKDARAKGKNIMIDQDAGREVWHQPLKRVTDVAYVDHQINEFEAISAADLVAGNSPTSSALLSQLISIEKSFTLNLIQGRGVSIDQLCNARKSLGEGCEDLKGLTLSQQANVYTELKQKALQSSTLKPKESVAIISHELIVEYGIENDFASASPDRTRTESYRYITVSQYNKSTKTIGKTLRSQYSIPTRKVRDICRDQKLGARQNTSLTKKFDFSKCSKLNPEREYFVGSVPLQSMKTIHPEPTFSNEQAELRDAYNDFKEFIKSCSSFDEAAQFFQEFDRALLDNSISSAEASNLKSKYGRVKNLLDGDWMKWYLNQKGSVSGLSSLRQSLSL